MTVNDWKLDGLVFDSERRILLLRGDGPKNGEWVSIEFKNPGFQIKTGIWVAESGGTKLTYEADGEEMFDTDLDAFVFLLFSLGVFVSGSVLESLR